LGWTFSQIPSFSSAALAYLPAGTCSGSPIAKRPADKTAAGSVTALEPGFPVDPLPGLSTLAPPTAAELDALTALDPDRLRDLDFR
jgi:hypothetical protein